MDESVKACERGALLYPQVAARQAGIMIGLETHYAFAKRPTFVQLKKRCATHDALVAELRKPAVKAAILSEADLPPKPNDIWDMMIGAVQGMLDQIYWLGTPPNYEPGPEQSIARIVESRGQELLAGAYDLFLEENGHALFLMAAFNFFEGNHDVIRQQLTHPWSVSGLSDGGAHCGMISDASNPTFMLTHWARDRSRGPKLPIEWVVKKQTQETANLFGLGDRGLLSIGKKADLNVIDHERLTLNAPHMAHDLPAGGRRLLQTVDGYDFTIVSGEITREGGVDTGARPGRLVRGARQARSFE